MDNGYRRVEAVVPLAEYRLLLTFDDGDHRIFDAKPYLDKGVFAELKAPGLFSSVHVSFDTIEWSNGAGICPEALYAQSTRVESPETVLPS